MFHGMPGFVFERKVVGGGNVPPEEDQVHRQPCDNRGDQPLRYPAQRRDPDQGRDDRSQDVPRQAAQKRHQRKTEENQRRYDGHQKQVLYHVGAEKNIGEPVQRRPNRYPQNQKTTQERRET